MKKLTSNRKFAISVLLAMILILGLSFVASANSNNVTLTVLDSSGTPLDGINVYYNDYGNHWALVGTTAGGSPVTASFADGAYNFKAVKNYSEQIATVTVSGTGGTTFQTAKFTVHVTDSDGSNFAGIAASYNDYGNHYLSMGNTNTNGNASIELFPGTYTFKATKNYSEATGSLTNNTSGSENSITFQMAKFTVHVTDSDGNDFAGIAASYNDYGNHYLNIGNTDNEGKATFELFPGTYTFRATKDYSTATGTTNNTIEFQTALFTVHVKDSSGADFDGIAVSYNDYGNHYLSMSNTDTNGNASIELFPGTYTFKATKNYTEVTGDLTIDNPETNASIEFQTAKAVAIVKDCDGTTLADFKVSFNDYGNHWLDMGTTGPDGKASIELFPGTRKIRAWKDYTYEVKDLDLTLTESTIEFNPTRINWQYSGTIRYNDYGNHWKTMTSPFYLFPGTYAFRFDDYQTDVVISGCAMEQSVLFITLKDSSGAGVPGGTAHLGVGGWPVIGTTDSNGQLLYFYNGLLGNMRIRMEAPFYGGSETSPIQDTTVNSIFNFQTQQVTIQLKDSTGNLTNGGVVRAGAGGWPVIGTTGDDGPGTLYHEHFAGTFKYRLSFNGTTEEQQHDVSTPFVFQTIQAVIQLKDHLGNLIDGGVVQFGIGGWPVIGTTGDGGTGQVTYEIFAGTYKFRMNYNYGTEEKQQDISMPVVFQTALVNLQFSGSIQHKVGGWPAYAGPTEMLPVSHGFSFTGCGYPRQDLYFTPTAGTVFEKSIVFASFLDSSGNGLAGGEFDYRFGWGSYMPLGTTPASGLIASPIDGLHTNTKFRVSYAGGTTGDQEQNIATDSCVVFQTVPVTAVLNDSSGAPLGGATFEYRYGWGSKMPFDSAEELLPIKTKITVHYMGAAIEKEQNASSNPNFVFNTVLVTSQLLASDSTTDLSGDATFEFRYGWGAYQPFTGPMELLPVNTKMHVGYAGGTTGDIEQNVGSNGHFSWQTGNVTSTSCTRYRYGWGAYQPFTSPMELLPLSTKFSDVNGPDVVATPAAGGSISVTCH